MKIFNVYLLFILSAYSDDLNSMTFGRSWLFHLYYSYIINVLPLLYEKHHIGALLTCYLFSMWIYLIGYRIMYSKEIIIPCLSFLTKNIWTHSPFLFPQHLILCTLNTPHGKDEKREKKGTGSKKRGKKKK